LEGIVIADVRYAREVILETSVARSAPDHGFAEDSPMLFLSRHAPAGCAFPEARDHLVFDPSHDELRHVVMIALISPRAQGYGRGSRLGSTKSRRLPAAPRRTSPLRS